LPWGALVVALEIEPKPTSFVVRIYNTAYRVISRLMHRETFIAKLTEIQQNVDFLLSQFQSSEHDKFAAHLYRSRKEYRSVCERAGNSGEQIERCVISTFQGLETEARLFSPISSEEARPVLGLCSR
jgi:hypothetical protein